MPISFSCPSCSKAIKAPDTKAGRTARCPSCGKALTVPGAITADPPRSVKTSPAPVAPPASPDWLGEVAPSRSSTSRPDPAPQTMPCPSCDEPVSQAAKKCKHCGYTIDAALRTAEEAQRLAENSSRGPMVFQNAGGGGGGGGGASAAAGYSSGKSAAVAAMLEVLPGLFLGIFGLGHFYAGNVGLGLLFLFGGWFLLFVNIMLCFVFIGIVTLPLCWLILLIVSPIVAASSCK